MQSRNIAFIGAGNMPRSIISGMVKQGYPANKIMASNPSTPKLDALQHDFSIQVTQNNIQACEFAEIIVLSVKPQLMEEVCKHLHQNTSLSGKTMVSIAAGISVKRLSEMLNGHAHIIRTMPNTPSALGLGMTGLYATEQVSTSDRDFVGASFEKIGKILWVEKESMIDAVIAAAGSSPAYFFLFAQAMQDEAMRMGFNKDDARLLVQQAMLGSAQMICNNPHLELSELRAQVTSKGGTTHEAVETLRAQGLESIVGKAMQAAVKRATEMSAQF